MLRQINGLLAASMLLWSVNVMAMDSSIHQGNAELANRVRESFGVFIGTENRKVRVPGKPDDIKEYRAAFREMFGYDIPLQLKFASGESWDDIERKLDQILFELQRDIEQGRGGRVLIRSGLLPKDPISLDQIPAVARKNGWQGGDDVSLMAGAAGVYDEKLARIAAIFDKYPKSVLDRVVYNPNWEYTGNWMRWSIYPKKDQAAEMLLGKNATPEKLSIAYKKYWQRIHDIVQTRLSGSGKRIKWSLEIAGTQYVDLAARGGRQVERTRELINLSYPGDSYVDVFGASVYCKGATNDRTVRQILSFVSDFAARHNLETGLGEMSTWYRSSQKEGNFCGDSPEFFTAINDWMHSEAAVKRLSHVVLFDVDTDRGDQHSVLFFDTRPNPLQDGRSRPLINPGMEDKWSNNPESRRRLIEFFKKP